MLVTTGTATLDATRSIHAFIDKLAKQGVDGVELWARTALLEQYLRVDPSTVYPARSDGFRAYADFFVAYGHAMSGELNERALAGCGNTRRVRCLISAHGDFSRRTAGVFVA